MIGCCSGGFGGGGFDLGVPIEEAYIPDLEEPAANVDVVTLAPATLAGGSYLLPRRVKFNRLIVRVRAFAALATGVVTIYQEAQGRVRSPLTRVATCPFTPAANTTFQITPDEGTVLLSAGWLYILWGQASGAGSFELECYSTGSIALLTASVLAGTHPTIASSALATAAPPASIDPEVGGDLVAGTTNDFAPVARLISV